MSRKWLEEEGKKWVEDGVVSSSQYDQLLSKYPVKTEAAGILPIMASVLVGLGILSLVAANWNEIPQFLRLLFLVLVMTGFYWSGERYFKKDQQRMASALMGLGMISFGASIILINQMYHLLLYHTWTLIIWGLAGVVLVYLYNKLFHFLLTISVFTGLQIYSISELGEFSYLAFAIFVIALGWYWLRERSTLISWLFNLSFTGQILILIGWMEIEFAWAIIILALIYGAGEWLTDRAFYPVQAVPLIAAFVYSVFYVMFYDEFRFPSFDDVSPWLYIPLLLIGLLISAVAKYRRGRLNTAIEWVLFLPIFYIPDVSFVFYLVAIFVFSIQLLFVGYRETWPLKINLGIILFIVSCLSGYFKFTWELLPRSVFFLVGGLLLFLLSWFLNRQRQRAIDSKGDHR